MRLAAIVGVFEVAILDILQREGRTSTESGDYPAFIKIKRPVFDARCNAELGLCGRIVRISVRGRGGTEFRRTDRVPGTPLQGRDGKIIDNDGRIIHRPNINRHRCLIARQCWVNGTVLEIIEKTVR